METNRPTCQVLEGPVERVCGALTVRHRERDLPHVQPLVKHILRALYESCTILGFPSGYALEVDLEPADTLPDMSTGLLGSATLAERLGALLFLKRDLRLPHAKG